MAQTGERIDIEQELRQLRALVTDQQQALLTQQQRLNALEGGDAEPTSEASASEPEAKPRSTRRQLLKLAGAAVAGAAGTAALRAVPAAAADGDIMKVGYTFGEQFGYTTGVPLIGAGNASPIFAAYNASSTTTSAFIGLFGGANTDSSDGVRGYASGNFATGSRGLATGNSASGVRGVAYGSSSVGVRGYASNGDAVVGYTAAQGRHALFGYTSATSSSGVYGYSERSVGVKAYSYQNTGVSARSYNGIGTYSYTKNGLASVLATNYGGLWDVKLAGTGRLAQVPFNGTAGQAPNFTSYGYFGIHELLRAGDGALWASRTTGTNRTNWKRINAVRVDTDDGLGNPFKPFRVKDTRSGAKPAAGSLNVVTVAGTGSLASKIPATAVAVVGNLTATGYSGNGFLAIMPAGITVGTGAGQYNPASDPSSVNFQPGQFAIANSFICGLNALQLQVYVGVVASHFIIDVTGYVE